MIVSKPQGRTGNLMLQNIGMSILSSKFDLKVCRYSELINQEILGLKLNQTGRVINNSTTVYDNRTHIKNLEREFNTDLSNCLSLEELLKKQIFDNGIFYDGTFQVKQFVTNYKSEILSHFDINHEKKYEQVFVHVRLGDVTQTNPGIDYYRKLLQSLSFKDGYISSDSPNHIIVRTLIEEFKLNLYTENDPLTIINFAKDFDNLILSKGTFSWWIALLSKANNIFFPQNDIQWYGDIFVYPDWNYIDIN